MEFIINDESAINSHGFRLINSGIRKERFDANPVVLFDHNPRDPIGVATGLRVEGTKMLVGVEFDQDDELAKRIEAKANKGHLRGASPGLMVYAVRELTDESGNYEYQVTDWELCELSIVSVPSNKNALRLYNSEWKELSADDLVKMSVNDKPNKSNMDKEQKLTLSAETYKVLGIDASAPQAQLEQAINQLSTEHAELAAKLSELETAKVNVLIDEAVKLGRIAADKKEDFVRLAKADFELAKSTIEALPVRKNLSSQIEKTTGKDDRSAWSYLRWLKEDPQGLVAMKENDPEGFEQLRKK